MLAERLGVLAHRRFHASSGVARVTRLTAGATQEIWRFDLTHDAGSDTPLILRRTPAGRMAGGGGSRDCSQAKARSNTGRGQFVLS